jgi:hypothetical protein
MELDDLKAKWQQETATSAQLNAKTMHQIETVLNGKALDMIASLQLKYEKIISRMLIGMLLIIFGFPFLSDGFTYPGSVNGFAKAMFFYLVLIMFYWAKLTSVNHLELSDQIKERLEQVLRLLNKNLRIELLFVLVFFVGFIVVGRFFYGHGLEGIFKPEVVVDSGIGVFFTACVLFLINKHYKKQISEFEQYLEEYNNAS